MPMSHVEFKKRPCRRVEFKKRPCRAVDFSGPPPYQGSPLPSRLDYNIVVSVKNCEVILGLYNLQQSQVTGPALEKKRMSMPHQISSSTTCNLSSHAASNKSETSHNHVNRSAFLIFGPFVPPDDV